MDQTPTNGKIPIEVMTILEVHRRGRGQQLVVVPSLQRNRSLLVFVPTSRCGRHQLVGTTTYSYDGNQITSIVQTDRSGNTNSFQY
jgi:hypothetical protein